MRRDTLLPAQQHDIVVEALYADADERGWETIPLHERTKIYGQWIENPAIGGVLCRYMTPDAARSWIKDGPMKEYAYYRRGAGRYARFGAKPMTTSAHIARTALGPQSKVVPGSEGVKPAHCLADSEGIRAYITWGPSSNFRNLLWAALRAAVSGMEAHIVVMEPAERPTSSEEIDLHSKLAKRCRVKVHHMRERLAPPVPRQATP